MLQLRKRGLTIDGQASFKASQTQDGKWVVWVEVRGVPLTNEIGKPRLFEGHTRYQAQCKAYKWYSVDPIVSAQSAATS